MNKIAAGLFALLSSTALAAAAATFPASNPAYYGGGVGIDSLWNTQVGPSGRRSSYRFRNEHAGALQAIRVYLKVDAVGYSGGNGGTVRVDVQTDDGTSNHFPSGTTLATALYTNPTAKQTMFPLLSFASPAQLQAGQIYHLVFSNTDPNPETNFISVNAVSMQSPTVQPTIKVADFAQLNKVGSNQWAVRAGFTPVLELDYADGFSAGMGFMERGSTTHQISGAKSVRQTMTVSGPDRTVYRATVRVARSSGSDPLTVRLEKNDGTVLEQGTIPASAVGSGQTWVSYGFSAPRTLQSGQSYRLVFTAPSSSVYSAYPIRQGAEQGFKPTTAFMDGYADFNAGSGWYGGWDSWGSRAQNQVLQFYFDVGGAPAPGDTVPPTVAMTAPASGAAVSGAVPVSATAADNVGVAGVQFRLDGADLGAEVAQAPYATTWNAGTAAAGAHALTAVARDAAGNRTTSAAATVTVGAAPPPGCLTSSPAWQNSPFSPQSAAFTATFDAVPALARIDGVTGLSPGAASGYASLAVAVRFNNAGYIDARDGGAYAAAAAIPYTAGATYRFRLAVDPAAHRYSVYVTPPGAAERVLGTNYAFRTEQAGASSLSNWALSAGTGSHQVCRFSAAAAAADTVPPAVAVTAPASGATVSGSVAVSATASDNVGVAGVQFRLDGADLGAEVLQAPYATTWNAAAAAAGTHALTAVARDAAGNRASASATVTVGAAPPPGCLTSSLAWQNKAFAAQTAAFTASFDAVPARAGMDGVTGLSRDAASGYASLAVAVRFNNAGYIDARNGDAYAAASSIPYTAGATYRFRLTVDPAAHRYSVYVTPPGAAERILGTNYAFRTEQAGASSLANWALVAGAGSHQVCGFSLAAAAADAIAPTVAMTAPASGATVSGVVTVSATASDNVGVAGVQFRLDGADLGAEVPRAPYATTWNAAAAPAGAHALTAVARDAAGNRATSAAATVTVAAAPPPACLTSSRAWQNKPFAAQSAAFTASFDAVPGLARMDGVTGLSPRAASGYTDLAVSVRFNNAGYIDALNGASYAAAAPVPYAAGAKYRFRLTVDPAAHRYSVYVTPPGAAERILGTNYAFRPEQAGASSLANWALVAGAGSHQACGLAP